MNRCRTGGDLTMANDAVNRFLGGSPLAVLGKLILLSILIGVVLSAFGLDPVQHHREHRSI